MGPCVALSGSLIEYGAPGNGFLKVPRLKGSAGHLRLRKRPFRLSGFLCLAQASGDHRKQGDGAPAVKQPPGRNGEGRAKGPVSTEAVFWLLLRDETWARWSRSPREHSAKIPRTLHVCTCI